MLYIPEKYISKTNVEARRKTSQKQSFFIGMSSQEQTQAIRQQLGLYYVLWSFYDRKWEKTVDDEGNTGEWRRE